jgi:hypothetical protein
MTCQHAGEQPQSDGDFILIRQDWLRFQLDARWLAARSSAWPRHEPQLAVMELNALAAFGFRVRRRHPAQRRRKLACCSWPSWTPASCPRLTGRAQFQFNRRWTSCGPLCSWPREAVDRPRPVVSVLVACHSGQRFMRGAALTDSSALRLPKRARNIARAAFRATAVVVRGLGRCLWSEGRRPETSKIFPAC